MRDTSHHKALIKTHAAHHVFVQLTVSQLAKEILLNPKADYRGSSVGIVNS
jgi:hypothetical protein